MHGSSAHRWHLAPEDTRKGKHLRRKASAAVTRHAAQRVVASITFGAACLLALLGLLAGPLQASAAFEPVAQPRSGSVRADSNAEFLAPCTVLTNIQNMPAQEQVTVSPVAGGELRLQPTLEDYFDGAQIDATKWISGYANPSFPNVPAPEIVNGAARLDATFLRAVQPFGADMPVRFFEASARFVTAPFPVAYADIGFYRSMPPLRVLTETSSIRLFVGQRAIESSTPRHMYVRSKDGLYIPNTAASENATDTVVDNWGADPQAQFSGLNHFRTFEIRWNSNVTTYLIDGSEVITAAVGSSQPLPHAGVSSATTYVSLFSQDPTTFGSGVSPLLVDWVRAGAYPAHGMYTGCVSDAGEVVNWSRVALSATIPESTSLVFEARTSVDGATWSNWIGTSPTASGTSVLALGELPGGRYFQYRVRLESGSPILTPQVESIEAFYFGPQTINVRPTVAYVNPEGQIAFSALVLDANAEVIAGRQVPVQWAVVFGGGVINEDGVFTAGAVAGRFTDTVQATSPGLGTSVASVNIGNAPVLNLSPAFFSTEGAPITLSVSASQAGEPMPLHLDWDLDNDGQFDDKRGEFVTYTFPKAGTYPIAVMATNAAGFTITAESIVDIQNIAPRIVAINVSAPDGENGQTTVEIIAEDVPASVLSYSFDWDNDGSFEVTDQNSNKASSPLNRSIERTVGVRVRDDSGGEAMGSTTIGAVTYRIFVPILLR